VHPPRLALDTSAYSWLRRGHDGAERLVSAADDVFLPAVVLGELEAAFQLGSRAAENRRALAELLAQPFVHTLDVTLSVSLRYGALFATLRRQGTPIPVNDMWIAATALDAGAHLVTFDADFGRIEGLPHTLLSA
jgi:tRNA(fMet)-specific endonuclease VapC